MSPKEVLQQKIYELGYALNAKRDTANKYEYDEINTLKRAGRLEAQAEKLEQEIKELYGIISRLSNNYGPYVNPGTPVGLVAPD